VIRAELTASACANQRLDHLLDRNAHLALGRRNLRAAARYRYYRENLAKRDVRPALHHVATKITVILQRPGKRKKILRRTEINTICSERYREDRRCMSPKRETVSWMSKKKFMASS
jgi:hypothetical protein